MCNPPIADGRANITQRKGISVMANVLFLYICDSFFLLNRKVSKCQSDTDNDSLFSCLT